MKSKRVVAAMSGGVDSAVTACLLKDRGFEVIGITMQIWERSRDENACCGIAGIEDAKKVAGMLEIPHYVLNFRALFKEKVINDFSREYREGRTPNPCIRCNEHIKFDALFRKAAELDAAYIATGHYARIEYDEERKRHCLKKGRDAQKDQSYVLYMMQEKELKHTLMPLGELTKEEVRKIARKRNLPVAAKRESQEICFIPDNNYANFLKERFPEDIKPGPIINTKGKVIGRHQGIAFYTIGQRKGMGIADKHPLYVARIDKGHNTITAASKEEVYGDELIAGNISFVSGEELTGPLKVEAKIRYLHPAAAATITPLGEDRIKVKFDRPQWAITPGQAVVFYDKDEVRGGGTILPSNSS